MQPISLLNYFKLCLLIVVCTAGSSDEGVDDLADIDAENAFDADAVADDIPDDAEAVKDETPDDADIRDDAVEDDVQVQDIDGADANPIDDDENENVGQGDEQVEDEDSKKLLQSNNVKIGTDVQNDNVTVDESIDNDKNPNKKLQAAFKLSAAEINKFNLWPEAKVPYFIDEFSYDKVLRDKIRKYLDYANDRLDIDFHELLEPPTDDNERWVFFVNRRGQLDCKDYSHKSFRNNGVQKVVVGYNCFEHGGPIAELVLALLGVPPVHNSPDRDRYITIHEKHILPDKLGLFKRLRNDEWLFHDLKYDFESVAHYPSHKYTADGSLTLTVNDTESYYNQMTKKPEPSDNALILIAKSVLIDGEATDYSNNDIKKVMLLYGNIRYNKAKKGLKLEDCKGLYRSRPGLSNARLPQLAPPPEKPKPKQYLNAIKKLYGTQDINGELLSELERK